jgi:Spy/CpxP family protein refolding chaperone
LALNAFLLAVIAVHETHRPPWPPGGPHGPGGPHHIVDRLAGLLSEPDATVLRQAFAAEPLLARSPRQAMGDDRQRMRAALRAEPFDPAALAAAVERGHSERDTFDQAIGRALIKAATALSPEGRRVLAEHGGPPGPPPEHGGPPEPPPEHGGPPESRSHE